MTSMQSTLLEQEGASILSLTSGTVKKFNISAAPVGFSICFFKLFDNLAQSMTHHIQSA